MINHPLVKKEWKVLKWMMLLFGSVFVLAAILLNQGMENMKKYHLIGQYQESVFMSQLYEISSGLVPILLIGLMVAVGAMFIYDRNNHVGKFISSLPYTRKQYFRIKYLMGMVSFTLPLVVFGIGIYMIRISHLGWTNRLYQYSPYGDILRAQDGAGILLLWLLLLWLIMVCTYSFLMMIQTLMGKSIVASIVGGIILLTPLFFGLAIPMNLNLLFARNIDYTGSFDKWIELLGKWIQLFLLGRPEEKLMGRISVLDQYNFITYRARNFYIYDYQWFPIYMTILVLGIIGTALLGSYFIGHNDVEKNGEIVLYPWAGNLLVIGITVCSVLLLPIIMLVFTGIENIVLTLVTMAIGGIVGYLVSSKTIEMTRNHG